MAVSGDTVVDDGLSALSWVHDELRRSLEAAHKALRRYQKAAVTATDLDPVDPSILRQARAQMHQAVGAVDLVGLGPAAQVLHASEAALQRLSMRPKLITAAAVEAIERGSFALLDYVGRRLANKPVTPLALFPQYRALQELAGASRIHPADLWPVSFNWRCLPPEPGLAPRVVDLPTIAAVEADLLAQMRGAPPSVAARMSEVFAALAVGQLRNLAPAEPGSVPPDHPQARQLATLWQLAAAFYEAQADGLLKSDVYGKRIGSRLLSQLRAGSLAEPSQRLAHDLLFLCSQTAPHTDLPMLGMSGGRRMRLVRHGYGLVDEPVVDLEVPRLGRFDPALVAQARKRVGAAKEVWSAVAGGDLGRLSGLGDQMALVSESLQRLYPDGAVLGRALQAAAQATVQARAEPPAELAMEVATALLYLDASLDDGDFDQPELPQRVHRLAQRIDQVRQQRDPGVLELWMEDLYRRVSDRQTMGNVVQELRASLSEVERHIDQYFRNPAQRDVLIPVPAQLQAMRGVLSVLGLDQASQAVVRMSEDVDALTQTEADPQQVLQAGTFERLAENLGALSFLIDMVAVQPQMAKSLFRFDAGSGNLSAVMARQDRQSGFTDFVASQPAPTEPPSPDTDAVAVSLEFDRMLKQSKSQRRAPLPGDASNGLPLLQGGDPLAEPVRPWALSTPPTSPTSPHPSTSARPLGAQPPVWAVVDPQQLALDGAATMPVSAADLGSPAAAAVASTPLGHDAEMREVFFAEAREALADLHRELAALQSQPFDIGLLTTVRRRFHTLKGSARMVGLDAFSEAAWGCEQRYNQRLAASTPNADSSLCQASLQAVHYLEAWLDGLQRGQAGGFSAAGLWHQDASAADLLTAEFDDDEPPTVAGDLAYPQGSALRPAMAATTSAAALAQRVPDLPSAADLDLTLASPLPVDDEGERTVAAPLPDLDLAAFEEAADADAAEQAALQAALQTAFEPASPATDGPPADPEAAASRLATEPAQALAPAALVAAPTSAPARPPAWNHEPLAEATWPLPAPLPAGLATGLAVPASTSPPVPARRQGPAWPLDESFTLADLPTAPYTPESMLPPPAPHDTRLSLLDGVDLSLDDPVAATTAALPVDRSGVAEEDKAADAAEVADIARKAGPAPVNTSLLDNSRATIADMANLAQASAPLALPTPSLQAPVPAPAPAPMPAVAQAPDADTVDLPLDLASEPAALLGQLPTRPLALPEPAEPLGARTSPLLPQARLDTSESFRQIGPLRVSVQLFNIFLAEADELLADLAEALQTWRAAPDRPPGERTVARAHSLAGNASTVGYGGLAHLARLLEHGLERAQARGHGVGDEPELFSQAADEIRRLLYLFAAGFLNPPQAQIEERLEALLAQDGADGSDQSPSRPMPLDDPRPALASPRDELSELAGAGLSPLVSRTDAPARAPLLLGGHGLAFDDEIDQQDAVDGDLFPVFEDEASELLPRLHASLRSWSARPADASLASACMRSLHTFKGGARLAGAMRLGEMAHRLETALERLVAQQALPSTADIDTLMAHADALDSHFERLRKAAGPTVMDSLHAPLAPVQGAEAPPAPPPPAQALAAAAVLPAIPAPGPAASTADPGLALPETSTDTDTSAALADADPADTLLAEASPVDIPPADVAQAEVPLVPAVPEADPSQGTDLEVALVADAASGQAQPAVQAPAQVPGDLDLDLDLSEFGLPGMATAQAEAPALDLELPDLLQPEPEPEPEPGAAFVAVAAAAVAGAAAASAHTPDKPPLQTSTSAPLDFDLSQPADLTPPDGAPDAGQETAWEAVQSFAQDDEDDDGPPTVAGELTPWPVLHPYPVEAPDPVSSALQPFAASDTAQPVWSLEGLSQPADEEADDDGPPTAPSLLVELPAQALPAVDIDTGTDIDIDIGTALLPLQPAEPNESAEPTEPTESAAPADSDAPVDLDLPLGVAADPVMALVDEPALETAPEAALDPQASPEPASAQEADTGTETGAEAEAEAAQVAVPLQALAPETPTETPTEAPTEAPAQAPAPALAEPLSAAPAEAPPAVRPAVPKTATGALFADRPGAHDLPVRSPDEVDWQRFQRQLSLPFEEPAAARPTMGSVRVRAALLDRLVSHAGEVSMARARIEADVGQFRSTLGDLHDNLERLRAQLRAIELQAETQITSRLEAARAAQQQFDPLEMDRFTRFQELTRMMAESVSDVATVQRGLQRTLQSTEDQLAQQHRMSRDMQDDLLRTRLVEFEGLSERLYRVVRQAAKETGKPVRLDIVGGSIEVDRGVLDRMTPAFEHLLRNSVVHGIEPVDQRQAAGKDPTGTVTVTVGQLGNEVAVEVRDDGAGLNLERIRERAVASGILPPGAQADVAELSNLIFQPGFTTAFEVTEMAGRGVGLDVVRTEVNAIGGRIETASTAGQGASFRLVLPLTTAVTQVVMLRAGRLEVAVPSTLVESVSLMSPADVEAGYGSGVVRVADRDLPFFWLGALLKGSARGVPSERGVPIVVIRSANRRVVLQVDEVASNQEVVVKHLGPQLARLPGLVGVTLLPSGMPALIYNPVPLATLHGAEAHDRVQALLKGGWRQDAAEGDATAPLAPLVMVVDDSLTVRRVTQRLLEREGYRVVLAKDGQEAMDLLGHETPAIVLSDIEMPHMDGFDLLRGMRASARWAAVPVVIITSRLAQKHRDFAADLGANHYLGKPYSEDELLALVRRHAPRLPLG